MHSFYKFFLLFSIFYGQYESAFSLSTFSLHGAQAPKQAVRVIFINGPSSAGKTTLARALQNTLDTPYLYIGLDTLICMIPYRLNNWFGGPAPQGFSWKVSRDAEGNPLAYLQAGPVAQHTTQLFKKIVRTMLKAGHHVIIDDICFTPADMRAWQNVWQGYRVLTIGLTASNNTLERNERARGDRMPGQARAQNRIVHKGKTYDLFINTDTMPFQQQLRTIRQKIGAMQ